MQLFDSDRGILRREGDRLAVLGVHDLNARVIAGELDGLRTADAVADVGFDDVVLRSPVRPSRLVQVGLNYRSHLEEIGIAAPESMIYAVTPIGDALAEPGAAIVMPPEDADKVDHECEIALVIGANARTVLADDAWSIVAAVTACNDVSARGLQRVGLAQRDFSAGKMLPGFKPLGPGLLTTDEVAGRPIGITLTVNGELRQQSDSEDMVFSIPELLERISAEVELVPGDVVMTGSPAGVGAFSGRFLQPGDVVEVTVGDLPPLRNTFRSAD